MRKLSNSFLLVGMIICYVCLGIFAITAIAFIILGTPVMENAWREMFRAAAENAGAGADKEDAFVIAMSATFLTLGFVFILLGAFCVPAAVCNGKARKQEQRGTYVAAIVFNALCGSGFGLAGAILGIIALARKERNDRRNNVVDAK